MNEPFVSVILPTFNRKELCRRAVSSVLAQTWNDFELIVVDDGSTDNTTAESLFEKRETHRCRYIKNIENYGVSRARNIGVSQARAAWLAFLDSDDVWHPEKLARQIAWINRNPACVIVQTREIWIRKGVRVNPPKTHGKSAGYIFMQSLARCMITPSSVMLKKNLFAEAGGFNESLPACEDYALWLRITRNHPVGLVDEPLLTRYGGREDQLSCAVKTLDKYRIRAMLDLLAHETLSTEQRSLVCAMLVKKAEIVAGGFLKRNRKDDHDRFRNIADRYRHAI